MVSLDLLLLSGHPRALVFGILEQLGKAGDVFETQQLLDLHSKLLADRRVGPAFVQQLEYHTRHAADRVLPASAIVADRGSHAILDRFVYDHHRQAAVSALENVGVVKGDEVAMKSVHDNILVRCLVVDRDDRLSVTIVSY